MGRLVHCQRCGYQGNYTGLRQVSVSCPHCKTSITLSRSDRRLNGPSRREALVLDRPQPREVVCHACSHEWTYRGSNVFTATCPNQECRTTVTFSKSEKILKARREQVKVAPRLVVAAIQF